MAPYSRKPENKPLPERWRYKHGAYYYRVPPGSEKHWDGKTEFRLGLWMAVPTCALLVNTAGDRQRGW